MTSPKKSQSRFERQKVRILDAATLLLNERGVGGMTFLDVADALDLTATSITYYFRYKEQLAAAVFEDTLRRLEEMAREAGTAPTPYERVDRYVALHFQAHADALRGNARPLAILSEIRTLEESVRRPLIEHYQRIFRLVRELFVDADSMNDRGELTARAQLLNEALFWSVTWLGRYAISEFDGVRTRLLAILENGLASPAASRPSTPLALDEAWEEVRGDAALLRVATRLINDIGYRGASVDRIAAELNLTKGTLYHYRDGKDDLVLACFHDSYRRLKHLQEAAEVTSAGSRGEGLWIAIAAALGLQFDGSYPLLRSTALQALPSTVRDVALGLSDRTALRLTGALVDGMAEGTLRIADPLIGSHLILSTINSAYDIRNWSNRIGGAIAVKTITALLMFGIF